MSPGGAKKASRRGVGVRTLKNQTSAVLRRVKRGETLTITDRNQPVAVLLPAGSASMDAMVQELCKTGRLSWGGGKPVGCAKPARVRGRPVSRAVIEDRR